MPVSYALFPSSRIAVVLRVHVACTTLRARVNTYATATVHRVECKVRSRARERERGSAAAVRRPSRAIRVSARFLMSPRRSTISRKGGEKGEVVAAPIDEGTISEGPIGK